MNTTGHLRDGDGTYVCDACGETFNGRYLHHFCEAPKPRPAVPLRGRTILLAVTLSILITLAGLGIGITIAKARQNNAAPVAIPNELAKARSVCRHTYATESCLRGKLRLAYASLNWQKHARGLHTASTQRIEHLRQFTCIHQGEGAWDANTGNGYEGGLQFDSSFSHTYGADFWRKYGTGPHAWTPRDQLITAERAYRTRGFYPWPRTARACGLI